MSLSFQGRLQYLLHHPEFRRHPLRVSSRLLCWMVCKKIGYAPEIKVHGSSRMRVHPERHGMGAPGLFYVFREGFENLVPYCIRAFVKPGQSCFDIGANVGIWSLFMAERCESSGHVYSFEPLSTNLAHLRENVRLSNRTNITIVPTALGRETGKVKIFTPDDPGRTSLAPEGAGDRVEEVALRRLDDVWKELNCPEIALVKMDVEGSEPYVIEGGARIL